MSVSLWPVDDDELVPSDDFDRRIGSTERTVPAAPRTWRKWLAALFPKSVKYPFAPHHAEFWDHLWGIGPEGPRPWLGVWAREGGKSTSLELASVALGTRGVRQYGLYVRRTQDKADDSVQNIGAKLASSGVETYYPEHGKPLIGKHGNRAGWRRNRLRTAGGFTMDAIGLDVASRGTKIEDDRPDFIIIDDIDEEHDNAGVTARKVTTITTALLPAGAENVAIFGVQNLIIADGIFSQLVDGRGEFLTDRIVSGPHPAVRGLKWEWRQDARTKTRIPVITAGKPTWAGQPLAKCERNMRLWGPKAFEKEAQHMVHAKSTGLALDFDEAEHFEDLTRAELLALVRAGRPFAGVDFGAWRFGFVAFVADKDGVVHRWSERFSQREELKVRAQWMHDLGVEFGLIVPNDKGRWVLRVPFPIWGDAANPQDIIEINAAFTRIGSPLRVVAVGADGKLRRAAVDRINEKFGENQLRFVRAVGATDKWLVGYHAGSDGQEVEGSRLLWEMRKWSYPIPAPGKVDLRQDPDDHTADGADLIAAMRYALMSWWRPAKPEETEDLDAWSPEVLQAEAARTWKARRSKKRKQFRHEYGDE